MHKPFLSYYITVERAFFARIYFSRASFFRDVRDLNSLREKRMIAKFPVLIFLQFYGIISKCFGCFFAIFCLLSSLLFAHSRKIDARENVGWPFANNRCARKYTLFSIIFVHKSYGASLLGLNRCCLDLDLHFFCRKSADRLDLVLPHPMAAFFLPNLGRDRIKTLILSR